MQYYGLVQLCQTSSIQFSEIKDWGQNCGSTGQAQNFQESRKTLNLVNYFTSDGVLNPNGVRFGSAEIYNIGKYYSNM